MSRYYRWENNNLVIDLYIQPNANSNMIAGLHGDRLKLKIKAPPIEGRANEEVIKFLADQFQVSKKNVVIIKGQKGRYKQVCILAPLRLIEMISRNELE